MTTIRNRAKAFLAKNGLKCTGRFVVSRIYRAKEDTARKVDLWWFDLPIRNIERESNSFYWLLCEKDTDTFYIFKVPNKFLLDNLSSFDIRYKDCVRLHLDEDGNDLRGHGKVNFGKYLLKQ